MGARARALNVPRGQSTHTFPPFGLCVSATRLPTTRRERKNETRNDVEGLEPIKRHSKQTVLAPPGSLVVIFDPVLAMDAMSSCSASSFCDSALSCETSFRVDEAVVHKVSKSDTIAGLAVKYNTTIADIKRVNGLRSDFAMFARSTLVIPSPGATSNVGSPFKRSNKYQPPRLLDTIEADILLLDSEELVEHQKLERKRSRGSTAGDVELIVTSRSEEAHVPQNGKTQLI